MTIHRVVLILVLVAMMLTLIPRLISLPDGRVADLVAALISGLIAIIAGFMLVRDLRRRAPSPKPPPAG